MKKQVKICEDYEGKGIRFTMVFTRYNPNYELDDR